MTTHVPGIDVSHYQGWIEWPEVQQAGKKFAFIKASEWVDYQDEYFRENWKNAKGRVLRGAYHFYREVSVDRQLENFIEAVGSDLGELPPVLDYEIENGNPNHVREMLAGMAAHWQRKPIIYTSARYWFKNAPAWSLDYDLWVADWTPPVNLTPPWQEWRFWQNRISNKGEVPGIDTRCDLDFFNGSLADLFQFAGLPLPEPEPVPPVPDFPDTVRATTALNVRTAPVVSNATKIGTVKAGTQFDVLGRSGDWLAVKAYVHGDYVEPV